MDQIRIKLFLVVHILNMLCDLLSVLILHIHMYVHTYVNTCTYIHNYVYKKRDTVYKNKYCK